MAVFEETVILIICMGTFKGLCYGILVSQTHPPTIIQIPTDSLKQIFNLTPTNDSLKDFETIFSPRCKKGSKLVQRVVPITRSMLLLILEEHLPQYFVDLIRSKRAPIDVESSIYAWFWEATTQNPNNLAHSAL